MTHGWWDVVAGTARTPVVVTVPRRLAPTWLLDGSGDAAPAYAGDYALAGSVRRAVTDDDIARGLVDARPTVE